MWVKRDDCTGLAGGSNKVRKLDLVKAMAGLIARARTGTCEAGGNVVFLHTGGWPALFGYADVL